VVDLAATRAAVVGCYGSPDAIDELAGTVAAAFVRAAPDEAMLLGAPGGGASLAEIAESALTRVDPDAFAVEATDGWAVWTLTGDGTRLAFSRVSALRLGDDGFVQGSVANVPVRVIALADRVDLVVPAMWAEHVRQRIERDCADIGVMAGPSREWPGGEGGRA
jgi:hypothetical protein